MSSHMGGTLPSPGEAHGVVEATPGLEVLAPVPITQKLWDEQTS